MRRLLTTILFSLTMLTAATATAGAFTHQPAGADGHAASCTVTGSYSSHYHDFDVYVRSNQPYKIATVTDASGKSASYRSNLSGYADIYLKASEVDVGERVTATVGAARCNGKL